LTINPPPLVSYGQDGAFNYIE